MFHLGGEGEVTATRRLYSVKNIGPSLWNRLPKDVRAIASLKEYKTRVRRSDKSRLKSEECGADYL